MVLGRLSMHPERMQTPRSVDPMTHPLNRDPLDRMLLGSDGTVTTLLQPGAGEAIPTRTTPAAGPLTPDRLLAAVGRWWHAEERLLARDPDERMIARRVVLRGARSDVPYLVAESLVAFDRLPAAVTK